MNNAPTVEVDYRGLHTAILSFEQGVQITGDPYLLPEGTLAGATAEHQRSVVKKLILTAINAPTVETAFGAFRNEWPDGHPAKSMTNKELRALLDAFLEKHPHLETKLGTDQGIRLMNLDSTMADMLIKQFTDAGTPMLSVHDSFIVPYDQSKFLQEQMQEVASKVVGVELEITPNKLDPDELKAVPEDERAKLLHLLLPKRSGGYLRRLEVYREGLRG